MTIIPEIKFPPDERDAYIADVETENKLLKIGVEMAQLRIRELQSDLENMRTALEPGKASAIVAGMFEEAQRLGHSQYSMYHGLTYLTHRAEAGMEYQLLVEYLLNSWDCWKQLSDLCGMCQFSSTVCTRKRHVESEIRRIKEQYFL